MELIDEYISNFEDLVKSQKEWLKKNPNDNYSKKLLKGDTLILTALKEKKEREL